MLVGVSINNDRLETVFSVTYNNVPLFFVGAERQSDDALVEIWALTSPDIGTHPVIITFSAQSSNGMLSQVSLRLLVLT